MKAAFILSALMLCAVCAKTQTSQDISIGKKEVIYSNILHEQRKLRIYSPELTSQSPEAGKRYPVLYLLDGDAHFFSTVGIVQQLSQANGNSILPEMIVVAIENTDRLRDLVPSAGSNKKNPFVDFLSDELMPYIDSSYKTAPYKILVGHSLGGLTAIDILTRWPQLFNAYIAADPSMWYNNEAFLNNTIAQLPKQDMNGKRLFIATANTLPAGMKLAQVDKDHSKETQHIRSIMRLDAFLKKNHNGLLYAQNYYGKEEHNTVPLLSEYDGLRFIFDYFHLSVPQEDFTDSTAALPLKLKNHYAMLADKMGYKSSPPESLIKYFAYEALGKKYFNRSQAFFELNIDNYPGSMDVYDSYADYFLAKRDTADAIITYKKALQIKSDAVIQGKLAALSGKEQRQPSTTVLEKYTGVYILESYNIPVVLEIRDGKIWAKVPGQADDQLQLLSENVFTVKGKQGYTITFQMDANKPVKFVSVQPNGTFTAIFKSKQTGSF